MGDDIITHPAGTRLDASMAKPKRDSLPHYEHLIFYVKLAAALIVVCISALTAAYMRNRNPNGWVAEQRQPMWSPKLETTTKDNKAANQKFAYAIQANQNDDILGVLTSVFSLKCSKTPHPVVCQYKGLNDNNIRLLNYICDETILVDAYPVQQFSSALQPPSPNATAVSEFSPRSSEFERLRSWQLTDFEKVVHLDMNTLILDNMDELFQIPGFAAARDPRSGCPLFDPAVMVLEPSQTVFENIADRLRTQKNGPYHPPAAGSRCVLPVVWQNYSYVVGHLNALFHQKNFQLPSRYNVRVKFSRAPDVQYSQTKTISFGNAPRPWMNLASQTENDAEAMQVSEGLFYSHMSCVWLKWAAPARAYIKKALEVPGGKPGATVNTPSNKALLSGLCPSADMLRRILSSPRACSKEPQYEDPPAATKKKNVLRSTARGTV